MMVRLALISLFYSAFLQNVWYYAHYCYHYAGEKISIPNSNNFGASSSEVAVAAPPWLTSESEDDEPLTHKLEVHACNWRWNMYMYIF